MTIQVADSNRQKNTTQHSIGSPNSNTFTEGFFR